MNFEVVGTAFREEFVKIATPRFEKEIAKGSITRSDVTPNIPPSSGAITPRKMTRAALAAPAPVAPDALARRREMSWMQFETQKAQPEAATGMPNIRSLAGSSEAQPHASARVEGAGHVVAAPGSTGRDLRSLVGLSTDRMREPVDSTLNKALLQHEFGEVSALRGGVLRPHASHVGVEPILREQMALRGDPEAVGVMQKVRQLHPDDALVQKAIRQVGGTPDAPLAIGGRQQRALERVFDRNAAKLAPETRLKAIAANRNNIPYVPRNPLGAAKFSLNALKDMGGKILHNKIGLMR